MAIRQTNFSGGEISPLLWGRTDLAVWGKALRTCRNYFPSKEGALVSRPGSTFITKTKFQDARPRRLIPFVVTDQASYVCEFGDKYIRFHANSAANVSAEIATTYAAADLAALRYAQVGDIMTLVHPDYPPSELQLRGNVFVLVPIDFHLLPTLFYDITQSSTPDTSGAILLNSVGKLFNQQDIIPIEWRWWVTALLRDNSTGRLLETAAWPITTYFSESGLFDMPSDNKVCLSAEAPVTITRSVTTGAPSTPYAGYNTSYTVVAYQYYRGRGAVKGFVGSTITRDFIDVGDEPNYELQPPSGKDPFYFAKSGAIASGTRMFDWPQAVGFFEERRVFARHDQILFSASDAYGDFDDESLLPLPTQALTYQVAFHRRETIRHLTSGRKLIIGTDATMRTMVGANNAPLSPATAPLVQIEDDVGCSGPPPLIVNGAVLYVRQKGRGVRAMVPDQYGYTPVSLSDFASHLFAGESFSDRSQYGVRSIVDWCYAEEPWGLVWAIRDDGMLLSLTFNRATGDIGWARHDTADAVSSISHTTGKYNFTRAVYQGICSVPEANDDGVYTLVWRGTAGYLIERFNNRLETGDADDCASVDCSLRFQGSAATTHFTGLAHLEGLQVYLVGAGFDPIGPLTVSGGAVDIPEAQAANFGSSLVVRVGLRFVPEMELLDALTADTRLKQKTVTRIGFEVNNATGLLIGPDLVDEHLIEWRQRTIADGYTGVSAATALVAMYGPFRWDKYARVALRQGQPLPVTILGLVREVDSGG